MRTVYLYSRAKETIVQTDTPVLLCSLLYWDLVSDWMVSVTELLDAALEEEGGTLIARKVGEAVQNTLGAVVGAIDIPLGEHYVVQRFQTKTCI